MNEQQAKALRAIADAIIDACQAAGTVGVPGGHLYALLMQTGMSLGQFEQIMSTLVGIKKVRKQGDCYFAA
jgi:hypothetical protein